MLEDILNNNPLYCFLRDNLKDFKHEDYIKYDYWLQYELQYATEYEICLSEDETIDNTEVFITFYKNTI